MYRLSISLSCQFIQVLDTGKPNCSSSKGKWTGGTQEIGLEDLISFWPEGRLRHTFGAGGQGQKETVRCHSIQLYLLTYFKAYFNLRRTVNPIGLSFHQAS